MAVGMTFVILTGGIDLSVGSILAVAGALAAGMLKAGRRCLGHLVALAVGGPSAWPTGSSSPSAASRRSSRRSG